MEKQIQGLIDILEGYRAILEGIEHQLSGINDELCRFNNTYEELNCETIEEEECEDDDNGTDDHEPS